MDNSKEFILMCEKAVEIQEKWNEENGDFVFWRITKSIKIITDTFEVKNSEDYQRYFIWLPRQDQLQDMVMDGVNPIAKISEFYHVMRLDYGQIFQSMEQLWLAFIMSELYNKRWNGKDWEQPK